MKYIFFTLIVLAFIRTDCSNSTDNEGKLGLKNDFLYKNEESMSTTTAIDNIDCNSQNCLNGGICDSNGTCNCADGFYGFDCSNKTNDVETKATTVT